MEDAEDRHDTRSSANLDVPLIRSVPDFELFYRNEFEPVAALAYVLSGSRLACDDLAQDAFVAAYGRWGEIGRYDNPGAWVRRAVANRSTSLFRRRVAQAKAVARLGHRQHPTEMPAESIDVWKAVRRLPKRQAQATALFYLEDMSLADIALVLDCAEETVRTHLRRARRTLAEWLEPVEAHDGS